MASPPDDQGVSALDICTLKVGIRVLACVDSDAVFVGVGPPAFAHLAADTASQLSPVASPFTHEDHPVPTTQMQTRAGLRRTDHPRPAMSCLPRRSRYGASERPERQDSAPKSALHRGPAPATAAVPCRVQTDALGAQSGWPTPLARRRQTPNGFHPPPTAGS